MNSSRNNISLENNKNIYYNMDNNVRKKRVKLTNIERRLTYLEQLVNKVKDVEEGTGRNVGRLGALVCEGDDDSRHIRVNVGSGFSDSDRDTFWNSRNAVLGKLVEVRADAITQNQDGSYSLRFPRFLHFRGFVDGEKI